VIGKEKRTHKRDGKGGEALSREKHVKKERQPPEEQAEQRTH